MSRGLLASVVVPCYNAGKWLLPLLESLCAQDERRFELVLVDDGSTDGSPELAKRACERLGLRARFFSQANAGPAVARNRGAREARAKTVVFLDSDCRCPPHWLSGLLAPLRGGYAASSCPYRTANPGSWVARYVGYEIAQRQERLLGREVDVAASYSFAVNRERFLALGGFDTRFRVASGEDFDFCFKLVGSGGRIFFTDATFVYHHHPESFSGYLRQQFKRGYWRVPMYAHNRDRAARRESYVGFAPQIQFVLTNLVVLGVLAGIGLLNAWWVAVPAVLLLLSNASLGAFCASREKKFALFAPVLASVRSLAALFGVYRYFWDRLFRTAR